MKYSDLADLLQKLERKFRCTCTTGRPCKGHSANPSTCAAPISFSGPSGVGGHVRPASTGGGNCQFFALDTTTQSGVRDLPVVVAIGANYTQDLQMLPCEKSMGRSLPNPPWIEEPLTTCRSNFEHGLSKYKMEVDKWQALAAAGSNMPYTIGEFHFVMTNICPWITQQSGSSVSGNWDALSASVQAELLTNRTGMKGGIFAHLDDLKEALERNKAEIYWCAHGLHAGVFPLFRHWQRNTASKLKGQWILLNNLSRKYSSYNTVFPNRNSK